MTSHSARPNSPCGSQFADIFELSNGGKPNMKTVLEIIELPDGITT